MMKALNSNGILQADLAVMSGCNARRGSIKEIGNAEKNECASRNLDPLPFL
jgi:hypothetical protein